MNKEYLLHGKIVNIADLDEKEISRMIEVFNIYFSGIKEEKFLKDLRAKDSVLLLQDASGLTQGFTTIQFINIATEGKPLRAIFSGNTIIQKEFWGKSDMPRVWMKYMLDEKAKNPDEPLYWFLICSGYKTYKMLPNYALEFWPRYDKPTPPDVKLIIDKLAFLKFGKDYDSSAGIIKFSDTDERLRGEYSEIKPQLTADPHINFFAHANPSHYLGHELACLMDFKEDNLNDYAKQILK